MTEDELKPLLEQYGDDPLEFQYSYKTEFYYEGDRINVRAVAEYRSDMERTMTLKKIAHECDNEMVYVDVLKPSTEEGVLVQEP